MCGIIGYAGSRSAGSILVDALARLEYRGYDSAGMAVASASGLACVKAVGPVAALRGKGAPAGTVGIGHTRWATHGKPSEGNAHPHVDCHGAFAVVHNGIIENHGALRAALAERGHAFASETDTEVLAHLIEETFEGDLVAAVRAALVHVDGSYAVAVVSAHDPDTIVVARQKSPLLVGLAPHGHLVASDATAVVEHTRSVVYLADGDVARVTADEVDVSGADGAPRVLPVHEVPWTVECAEKQGFEHFMLKEITEIPRAIRDALAGRVHADGVHLDVEGTLTAERLRDVDRVLVLACGTSYHAGMIAKVLIEGVVGVPVDVQLASEYRYGAALEGHRTLAVCVSQSGETADTLEALRLARERGCATLAVTNVIGATMSREADGVLYIRAGPEVSVAATKTFVNTTVSLYLLAFHLARLKGVHIPPEAYQGLAALPAATERVLDQSEALQWTAAKFLGGTQHAFFMGRQLAHGLSLEAALKLKEIAYIPADGYAAGELKHGPLALLGPGVPVIACAPRDPTYGIMMSNVLEVRARGAHVLALVDEDDPEAEKYVEAVVRVPKVPALFFPVPAAVALYLLAYFTARDRGCEIDRPRNLAKSVTVE